MRSRDTDLEPLNILVFGPTGAGKTTIINYLTSGQLPVGHSLESCTREVQVACTKHQGRLVNYFDTPGFDDSNLTTAEQFAEISGLSSALYKAADQTPNIHGVLYIHRITDNKMPRSTLRNIRVLENLLGPQAFPNLVYVTNMWGSQPDPKHVRFEKELMEGYKYFASAIEEGARAGADFRIPEGATQAQVQETLSGLFLNSTPVVIQIQRDLVDEKRALRDTDAGRMAFEGVEQAKGEISELIHELERDFANFPEGREVRKKRITLEYEDAKIQFAQVKKQEGILQMTLETIRGYPYMSTLVAMAAMGTGAIVLGSGQVVVVTKLACAAKVAASGVLTTTSPMGETETGIGLGAINFTINGDVSWVALAVAAAGGMGILGEQDEEVDASI